jgi:hypothetical protein
MVIKIKDGMDGTCGTNDRNKQYTGRRKKKY